MRPMSQNTTKSQSFQSTSFALVTEPLTKPSSFSSTDSACHSPLPTTKKPAVHSSNPRTANPSRVTPFIIYLSILSSVRLLVDTAP
jgi:hypothetical protein